MKLDITREGDVSILEFTGELDAFNLVETAKQIDALIEAGDVKLVLDMKRLFFINSSGLGYLIKTQKKAKAGGGDAVLVQPSLFLRKTLVTMRLDRLFCVYQTVDEGISHFSSAPGAEQAEITAEADEKLLGGNVVLFSLVPQVGLKRYVGHITSLYRTGLKFRWVVPQWSRDLHPPLSTANFDRRIHTGGKLRIKFRQPFLAKDHYFEMDSTIDSVSREVLEDGTDQAILGVKYDNAKPEDLEMLSRFVDDMAELKAEVDQARDAP